MSIGARQQKIVRVPRPRSARFQPPMIRAFRVEFGVWGRAFALRLRLDLRLRGRWTRTTICRWGRGLWLRTIRGMPSEDDDGKTAPSHNDA